MEKENHCVDLEKISLLTNSPKYYEEYVPYANVLMKKIKDKSVKNIGIVAPYGAGKSSLIATLIEKNKLDEKVISVSLANYDSIIKNVDCNQKDDKKTGESFTVDFDKKTVVINNKIATEKNSLNAIENDEEKIEKSILQQLFYKNDNKNTPASRFKVLKDDFGGNVKFTIELVISLISILFLSFQFFNNLFFVSEKWSGRWYLISAFLLTATVFVGFIIYNLIKNKSLKSVQLGEFNFEKTNNDSISVFNQYLDEIIYFFQKNNYNILIIEDLDRFKNLEIFSKLKELNNLLNNNEKIVEKHGKITFIYAVKDSLFNNEEERSKFFEFILPIIPSITSDNVKDQLNKTLEEKLWKSVISNQLINDVADYIQSRRVLNNIINDFIIHLGILKIKKEEIDKMDKLFCLMVLKNIFPLEYEKLQNQSDQSKIYFLLNSKKLEIQKQMIGAIDEEILKIDEKLKILSKETLKNFKELKILLWGAIAQEVQPQSGFKKLNTEISSFKDVKEISCYTYYGNSYISLSDIEKKYFDSVGYFYDREKKLADIEQNKTEEYKQQKNKLLLKKNAILNMSFFELYNENHNQIEDCWFGEDFIKFAMVNGYIDETHMEYLSLHSYEFMTPNDKNIVKRINKMERIEIFEKTDSPEKIILGVVNYRFMSPNNLNYFIVNELVNNASKYAEKSETVINCLKQHKDDAKNFIEKVVGSDENYSNLIVLLIKHIPEIWGYIYDSSSLSEENKEKAFWNIINHELIDIENIKSININNCFFDFLNKTKTFINKFNSHNLNLLELSSIGKIEFDEMETFNKNDISSYILENNCYKINFDNIKKILIDYYGESESRVESNNYDIICSLPECSLKNRIENNINEYIKEIYDNVSESKLCEENLLHLLLNDKLEKKLKIEIINKETSVIEFEVGLDAELVSNLMRKKQIKLKIEDIIEIFDDVETNLIIDYIEQNSSLININKEILESNQGFKQFFFENINLDLFLDKISNDYTNIKNFSEYNIEKLILNKKCKYCVDDCVEFISTGKYIEEYCSLFSENISIDIVEETIELDSSEIKKLYFISKGKYDNLFNSILKTITATDIEEILSEEEASNFINSIQNINVISDECKIYLLNANISDEKKEYILCNMKNIENTNWKTLMRNSLGLNELTNKYTYNSELFYAELSARGVNVNRRNGVATIKFDN